MRELLTPPDALQSTNAVELFRGWIIDGRLQCVLLPTAFDDHRIWGVLLADAAHHIANALAEEHLADPQEVIRLIRDAFNVEMRTPTDEHFGEFVDDDDDFANS